MALETGTFISDLVTTNPTASDPKSAGDDHLRLLKSTIKATFPNVTGAVTPTHTELNFVDGVTSAIQTQIDGKAAHTGQVYTGTHTFPSTTSIGNVSATEIAYLDGVTSAVQTQIDSKAPIASPTFTGNVTVPTPVSPADAVNKAYADGLAFATTLPAQAGNAGKFVTTNGTTASWAFAGIANVTTATTATTLTNTPTLLQITPASYGVTVTLPNATTCSVGGPLHCIDNQGAYPVRVCDSTGALKGFIFAGVVSYISLDNNSTAAGQWAISSNELVGASAQLLTTNMTAVDAVIDIGSNQEVLIGRGASSVNCFGVVYNRATNTFGSVTLIRSATFGSNLIAAVLSGTNQVLVTSVASGAATFEAVTLSISGTTITVNTAATATLSANISAFADGCGLIAVGSSFVTSYTVATPAAQIRALSISGTTVTIGAAQVLDGTAGGLIAAAANHVIAVSTITTSLWTRPYLVSGSTLTAGTSTTTTAGTTQLVKLAQLGTRWFVGYIEGSTNTRGGVISLNTAGNGTTTISTALLDSASNTLSDAIVVGSSKVLVLGNASSLNANILTDTAGTASAGTAITLSAATSRTCLYVSGTDAMVFDAPVSNIARVHRVSCSGASPVLTASQRVDTGVIQPIASNSVLSRAPQSIFSNLFTRVINSETAGASFTTVSGADGVLSFRTNIRPFAGNQYFRGKADSERWIADASTVITKLEAAV